MSAFAQAPTAPTAAPPPYVRVQYFDNNGVACAGCALWTYAAGTNTLQATFTDQTAMTSNTDPVILDASGRAAIYIVDLAYKFVLEQPIPIGMTHGTTIWTVDNIVDTGLIALGASGGGISTTNITYTPPFSGSVGINLGVYLLSQAIDVRTFGATGYTGNCSGLTEDDQPYIQAALNYAAATGPANVFLPTGFCWPIQRHIWTQSGVHLYGEGMTSGYKISSPGSLLIANANWATTNTTFPYSQMVWQTGNDSTSGTFTSTGTNQSSEIDHLEINCNDQAGCGNVFAAGRQEKSWTHDLLLTGSVPFSSGWTYAFYGQGQDCNGNTPPTYGCLVGGTTFNQHDGPDERIQIFPSYSTVATNVVLFGYMGAYDYKGLRDSTLNGVNASTYALPYGMYFWGEKSTLGPGIHTTATVGNKSLYIGNVPAGSGCTGGTQDLFTGFDTLITIPNCLAQTKLTFVNDALGITNNVAAAPTVNITDTNYYYDQPTQTSGMLGSQSPTQTSQSILMQDPATYVHNGYLGLNFFNGASLSGMNLQVQNDTNSVNTRGHVSSNAWWNHFDGMWHLGGGTGTDYGSVGYLNGGVCLSTNTSQASPFTMATWLGNCAATVSDAHNLLVGPGWVSTSTGLTQGEGTAVLQVSGDIGSGTVNPGPQMAQASSTTCPTAGSAGATCTFTVPWSVNYANATYSVVCSLLEATGAATIHGMTRSTGSVSVVVQNGTASQAIPSGASGAACWAQP